MKYIQKQICSTVTVNKHTIIDLKKLFFGKHFHFWQWLIEYIQCCTSFDLLNLILHFVFPSSFSLFILYFLFTVHHLSTFKHCFCFFCLSTVSSFVSFSVLFLLFCYFNILFLNMALCLFIANSVYYASKLIK